VHTPRHARSISELSDDELSDVAEAWRRRRESEPHGYLHALVNEGREAGSSLPHTHSQLVWLPDPPVETQRQVDRERWTIVTERDGLVLACPYASRLPYEVVVAPRDPRANAFGDDLLSAAIALLGDAVRRIHSAAGAVPLNAWLHDSADWHIELVPRLSILAGVELGAAWWINALAPEDAAAALRS
jgi:UDPglucose--hexose-1-phosphate uridylyltransferase